MKFNVLALVLALSFPFLTAAECAGCDTKSLDAIGQCTPPWVDKIIACQNSPCSVEFPENPVLQCEGNFGDGSINVTNTIVITTQHMTSDSSGGTLFPMPTIINDIDPSTSPNAATDTPTGTSTPTVTSTSTTTGNRTGTGNSTTTTGPRQTGNSAAALAFGGIGFGGGAAAMVGLAGLVGLVL